MLNSKFLVVIESSPPPPHTTTHTHTHPHPYVCVIRSLTRNQRNLLIYIKKFIYGKLPPRSADPPTYVHVRARHLSGSRVNQAISKDFVQFLHKCKNTSACSLCNCSLVVCKNDIKKNLSRSQHYKNFEVFFVLVFLLCNIYLLGSEVFVKLDNNDNFGIS